MKKKSAVFLCAIFILSIFAEAFAAAVETDEAPREVKVSVVIPVYNSESYIAQCLDSITNQTLKEIEIICVNDGSTDDSLKILKEYEKKDIRIVVADQENAGAPTARNKGMDKAHGEFITFVDSDDYLSLQCYETAYKEAKENDLDILNFGWNSFPIESRWDHYKSSPKEKMFVNDSVNAWFYCGTGANVNIWNKLYKRSFINKYHLRFKENLKCAQDLCFNYIAFPKAERIKFIPDKLYNYRRDSIGSITRSNKEAIHLKNHIEVIKDTINAWIETDSLKGFETRLLTQVLDGNIAIFQSEIPISEKSVLAKEFLNVLTDKIYNPKVISKLSKRSKNILKTIENYSLGKEEV